MLSTPYLKSYQEVIIIVCPMIASFLKVPICSYCFYFCWDLYFIGIFIEKNKCLCLFNAYNIMLINKNSEVCFCFLVLKIPFKVNMITLFKT